MGYLKSLKLKIIRFRQLSTPERRLFGLAFGLLPGLAFSLKWRGLARTQKMLARFPFHFKNSAVIPAERIGWIVQVVARQQPAWGNCLNQSVLLWWLLNCHHFEGELRFGVRREPVTGHLEAHAWVEYRGQILNDSADVGQRFAPLEYPRGKIVL